VGAGQRPVLDRRRVDSRQAEAVDRGADVEHNRHHPDQDPDIAVSERTRDPDHAGNR
jgi:hypothetical protein